MCCRFARLKIEAGDAEPAHTVLAEVRVTLVDENDNSPAFTSNKYDGAVFANQTLGMLLVQVSYWMFLLKPLNPSSVEKASGSKSRTLCHHTLTTTVRPIRSSTKSFFATCLLPMVFFRVQFPVPSFII